MNDHLARRLGEKVPLALGELVLGIRKARERERGPAEIPADAHAKLVRTLLRLIFVLYAEARGLLKLDDEASPTRLVERLRAHADASSFMAWEAIREAFHTVRERHEPSCDDRLFSGTCQWLEAMPLDDVTVKRVLTQLTSIEEGGRSIHVDYGALEIEQLGGFYESLMGFELSELREPSVLVRTRKAGSLPVDVIVGLRDLLDLSGERRVSHLEDLGVTLTKSRKAKLEAASNESEIVSAMRSRVSSSSELFPKGAIVLRQTENRRRSGSHYTPRELAEKAVLATLEPIFAALGPDAHPAQILELKVCDPAMGSGAFLLASCRILADKLVTAWERHGSPALPEGESSQSLALRLVAERCIHGVDKDEIAVELARLSLWLLAGSKGSLFAFADQHLRHGDSLVERAPLFHDDAAEKALAFAWESGFPEVFSREEPGFDAMVGNPPWISYAGRAAQPLPPWLKAHFAQHYEAFTGYRNLQGLFVERAAKLLRRKGRLGFVLPSSMSEQDGYAPTRLAHDKLCEVDRDLPDLGEESFAGVVQPCMILLSTRRAKDLTLAETGTWPVERPDLDEVSRAILAKMSLPPLPSHLFGERGIQTQGSDVREMSEEPTPRHTVALRTGTEVLPFERHRPSLHADPGQLGGRLQSKEAWLKVRVLIRQTARVPMAALSDGLAFRNSILAGFEDDEHPATFLVAYLNSSPIRFLHYMRYRDARQGMPQVKIGHLRRIPAPPNRNLVDALSPIGEELSRKNQGIDDELQTRIDDAVADAFDLDLDERERIRAFANSVVQRSR